MSEGQVGIPRRTFLKAVGLTAGGLALGFFDRDYFALGATASKEASTGFNPNVFIHVADDGAVSIVCHRSEMGQGIRSSLPALIADEMGADLRQVKIVQGDGDQKYGDQNTDGSTSIRERYKDYRVIGATARVMLVGAAAQKWKVPAGECDARDGNVLHLPSKRTMPFREIVTAAAALPVPKPTEVKVRPLSQMKHAFRDLPLVDGHDIVTGKATFGADVRLPGMLVAVIDRPPVVGGRVSDYDKKAALAIPGVKKVIEMPQPKTPYHFQPIGGVAVVAENTWAAMRGRKALGATFQAGENGTYDSPAFNDTLTASVRKPGKVVRKVGDVDEALAKAAKKIEAEYHVPHLAHATMEPLVALAHYQDGKCECWAPTQNPQGTIEQVAETLGIGKDKVTVHVTLLGGGFGRKSKPDYVAEAAWLSREMGAPVRVQWTREDDMQHDYYHTVSAQRLEGALDASGKVTAWKHRTAFPSISSTFANGVTFAGDGELQQGVLDIPLAFPNVQSENCEASAHVRIGWLRSVCNIQHAFAMSSFLDELAHARQMDPIAFLKEAYGHPRIYSPKELGAPGYKNYNEPLGEYPIDVSRFHHILDRLHALSDWKNRARHKDRALGIAVHRSFVTYVGAVVAMKKDAEGKVRVDEAWVVTDAGTIVNTERARSQMEGAVIFGMSHALFGAITLKQGAVEQSNYGDFRVARMGEAPRQIHVELVKSEKPPGGVGEPGVPPIAPAIANAIFALTGKRVRRMPFVTSGLI